MQTDTAIQRWIASKNQELHSCGDGLYIRGFLSGRKLFQLRISVKRKRRWINIGDYPQKSLLQAKEIALAVKRAYKSRKIQYNQLQAAIRRADSARALEVELNKDTYANPCSTHIPTFEQAFRKWYDRELKINRWTHRASVKFPLTAYELHAHQHIGHIRMDKITRPMIKKFMQPLFLSNYETARKLLGYIYKIFEIASENELRDGNPCPRKDSFTITKRKVQHSSSLHFSRLNELWRWLEDAPFSEPIKAAMRLSIVTTHRAGLIANMRWDQFDCNTGIWIIPGSPTGPSEGFVASDRQFLVKLPRGLSKPICELPKRCEYVFTVNGINPINAETLRRNFQKFANITTDGFRNTFKTWCLSNGIEQFLADRYCDHALKRLDKSYRKDELFKQRAQLAEQYYDFCTGFEWFIRRNLG